MTFDFTNPLNYRTEEDIVVWIKYRKRLFELLCQTTDYFVNKLTPEDSYQMFATQTEEDCEVLRMFIYHYHLNSIKKFLQMKNNDHVLELLDFIIKRNFLNKNELVGMYGPTYGHFRDYFEAYSDYGYDS